jgi:O-antigen/teichoic acid export membrane protein
MNVNILNVKGRSDLVLKVGLVKKAVNLALLFAALPFGVLAIAMSQVVGSLLALIPNAYYSAKLIDYGLKDQFFDVLKPLLSSVIAAVIAWFISSLSYLPLYLSLATAAIICAITYLLTSYVLRANGMSIMLMMLSRLAGQRN